MIVFTLLYTITMLVSISGNNLLIYFVWKKPEIRSMTSLMFVNMAMADLLVTLVMMPWSIAHFYTEGKWLISGTLGDITCKGVFYSANVTVMASIFCLSFMAIDRHHRIVCASNQHIQWFRKAKFVSPLIWIMSMALMSIILVFVSLERELSWCSFNFAVFGYEYETGIIRGFFFYLFAITYLLPLLLISILYAKVARKIWFHQTPGNQGIQSRQRNEIAKRRAVRMLIIIVVVFALCWLPAQAYHLFLGITEWEYEVPPYVMYLVFWMGHANSAINPWLYIGLSNKIKSAFRTIVSPSPGGRFKCYSQITKSTKATMPVETPL